MLAGVFFSHIEEGQCWGTEPGYYSLGYSPLPWLPILPTAFKDLYPSSTFRIFPLASLSSNFQMSIQTFRSLSSFGGAREGESPLPPLSNCFSLFYSATTIVAYVSSSGFVWCVFFNLLTPTLHD